MKLSNFSFMSNPIGSIQEKVSPDILTGIAAGTGLGTVAGIGGGSILNMYTRAKNTPEDEAKKHQVLTQQFNQDMQSFLDNQSDPLAKQQINNTSDQFLSEEQRLMNQYGKPYQGQILAATGIIGGGIAGGLLAKHYR